MATTIGLLGDAGGSRYNSSRFYYFPGGGWLRSTEDGYGGANKNINSFGPAGEAVNRYLRSQNPDHILALGDQVYNTGASTQFDDEVGRLYNDFMAPYPSPRYIESGGPYRSSPGKKVWPYDTYDYPNGYPSPATGGQGGSPDGVNRFWPTPGNHEYYLRASATRSEINIGLDSSLVADPDIKDQILPNSEIVGRTSTAVPQPYLDYFGWQEQPELAKSSGLKIGKADGSGQAGMYYKVSLGHDKDGAPLVDVFSIDAMRLVMNIGGKYPTFTDGFGAEVLTTDQNWNLAYDPTLKPDANNAAFTTAANSTVPDNGWQQFRWLKRELKQSKARWQIVMGHQTVYSSGEWGTTQPDDNMSTPVLQKFLKGLPKGSFDAYFNGHAHYHQRVLEGNDQGIGQGIPFVTIGNSGRLLDPINETQYGDNVYEPRNWADRLPEYMGVGSKKLTAISPAGAPGAGKPYSEIGVLPFLLNSQPTTVSVSGGYKVVEPGGKDPVGFSQGAYGFGFGGATVKARKNSLFYKYEQPPIEDPAILDNLNPQTRLQALQGWDGLESNDWRPHDPITGQRSASLSNTAQVRLTFDPADGGAVSKVSLENGGSGYMASRGGNHVVDFEVRGNDPIIGTPLNPNDVAIVRLGFDNGSLSSVTLLNDGSGYQSLGQVMQQSFNEYTLPFAEVRDAVVPVNLSLLESWYEQPDTTHIDSYLITETKARATLRNPEGRNGEAQLSVKIVGEDRQSRRLLSQLSEPAAWTTGYSGVKAQRAYRTAQSGQIIAKDKTGRILGEGQLTDGVATFDLARQPEDGALQILFGGDSTSSYLVNYRSSSTWVDV